MQGDPIEHLTPELPSIQPEPSPLWPQNLVDLFIRPRKFFSSQLALGETPYVVFVTWCYGVSNAIDRIDQELLRAEFGSPRPGWERFGPFITGSWLGFWAWVLAAGVLGGLGLWWIGGWWYRVRLSWSGAVDPDKRLARLLFVYSSFVFAGPVVAFTIVQTSVYPTYAEAYASEDPAAVLLLVFIFWSLISSYIGVRTLFDVSRWKARLWFLILPGSLYVVALGVLAALFAFFEGAPT